MGRIKKWWKEFWLEEYELIISVSDTVTTHAHGARTETWKEKKYSAKKLIKTTPTHFVFIDVAGRRNEIKFLNPVDFHVIKIW